VIDKKTTGECIIIQLASWLITSDARFAHEIKSRIAMAKARFTEKKILSTSKFDLIFSKELMKCHFWSIYFYGAETLKLQSVVQKCLGNFDM